MKKIILLIAVSLSILTAVNAQKIKVTSGDMSFMKDLAELSIVFEFPDDMKYGKMTQAEYIVQEKEKREGKEEGSGDAWEEAFISDRDEFKSRFLSAMEQYAGDLYVVEDDPDYKYTMQVKSIFTEPGFNIGIRSKNSIIDLEISFIETASPENVIAIIKLTKATGTSSADKRMRVADAYAMAARSLGKYFKKKCL